MYKVWVGTNIWVIPVPGFENTIVVPIPTPDWVPIATVSTGLKYNSLFSWKLNDVLNPTTALNLLGSSYKTVVALWAAPVVPSTSLKTLMREDCLSMFSILTLSSSISNISFSFSLSLFNPLP